MHLNLNNEYENLNFCVNVLLSCKDKMHKIPDKLYDEMVHDTYNWALSYVKQTSAKIKNKHSKFLVKHKVAKACDKMETELIYILNNAYRAVCHIKY